VSIAAPLDRRNNSRHPGVAAIMGLSLLLIGPTAVYLAGAVFGPKASALTAAASDGAIPEPRGRCGRVFFFGLGVLFYGR
jgi:hypothetical protein